ncbi:MAG: NAD(P)H-hydrate dehydratase [Acidobacteria bacterium]|nr:NAD(P)H-hydrate dehydratase [Acidobacteriota bacterium]
MKIVTAAEMRAIDRMTTEKHGIPSLTLMENAGSAVADFVRQEYPEAQRIGVICGRGNNGGDGFVAARKLHEAGKTVKVLLLADPSELKGDAAEMYKKLPVKAVIARNEGDLKADAARDVYGADLLLDAIFGTGFKPPVNDFYAQAIGMLRERQGSVVSVDLPSGRDADGVRQAGPWAASDGVVTFTAPKLAHVLCWLSLRGPVVVAPIGTPPEAIQSSLKLNVITSPDDFGFLKFPRLPQAHKGDFGHVLVIGGSLGKAGAAAMAGMAALRAGAGLITVAVPSSVLPTVAGFAPELMTEPLEEDSGIVSSRALEYGRLEKLSEGKSVIALGPGISRHPEAAEFVRTVVAKSKLPLVLDADGLNAFEGHADKPDGSQRPLVLTPHPGEMARLTGLSTEAIQKDRVGVARKFAAEHKCIVVLKGWRTLIARPDGSVWVNTTGNPGMATGGTGDVLTGMIASLLAQYSAEQYGVHRVLAAVHLHGLAGDLARDELGEHSMTATDLLRFLPPAFRRIETMNWPRPGKDPVRIVG